MKAATQIIDLTVQLRDELAGLYFSDPVSLVYQPLDYAWSGYREYIERYMNGRKRVVFLGMNPGPFGMAQTGVPFGEVAAVKDWMGIETVIQRPVHEHPKRPIDGFACKRSEVSGRRLWGLFAEKFMSADAFFEHHAVLNYCPLVWMTVSGANVTPDKIRAVEIEPVETACLKHLAAVLEVLQPEFAIGVGAFAEERLRRAIRMNHQEMVIGKVLHPSPASPAANRGWAAAATLQLEKQGVW
jgi:single-strand selective monofunctional uracil DNA glycosylase